MIKQHIPNVLSMANGMCGFMAILFAFEGQLIFASYAIFFGAVLDFLDGFLARLLQAQSLMGKQLDTLADMVTFGVAPASIAYILIKTYETCPYRPYVALCIVAGSALRLAKFTIDPKQTDEFIGLPTPANAMIIALLPIVIQGRYGSYLNGLTHTLTLPVLVLWLSSLLVAPIPFWGFKFKTFDFQSNKYKYIVLILGIGLVALFKAEALLGLLFAYIIFAIVNTLIGG